jgi:hypothetical protein
MVAGAGTGRTGGLRRSLLVVVFLAAIAAAILPAGTARAAVSADAPIATLDSFVAGQPAYRVVDVAHTQQSHNRTEGRINVACDGESPDFVDFIKDYGGATTSFVTPTATIILLEGHRCTITVDWLIGGAGHDGENGTSPRTVIDTTPQIGNPRFSDDTKASARSLRDAARRQAAKNYFLAGLPGLQPLLAPAVIESALGGIAGRIALDPPDAHYRRPVKRRRVAPEPLLAAQVGSAAAAMNRYLAAAADAAASGIALTTAIDRAQGARISKRRADRKRYDRAQMLAAAGFGQRLARELRTLRSRQAAAAVALRACGCTLATMTVPDGDWTTLRDSLVRQLPPADLASKLRRLHLQADLIRSAGLDLSSVDQLLPGTLPDELGDNQELHTLDNLRISLSGWAKAAKRHPTATPPD